MKAKILLGMMYGLIAAGVMAGNTVAPIGQVFVNDQQTATNYTYTLDIHKPVSSFTVSGNIALEGPGSLARIVLCGRHGESRLLFEAYPLLTTNREFRIEGEGEETVALDDFEPVALRVQVANAAVEITSVEYNDVLLSRALKTRALADGEDIRSAMVKAKIDAINEGLARDGRLWRAGDTSVGRLTYDTKKKLMGVKPNEELPNLQGFEYYKGGIFEFAPDQSASGNQRAGKFAGAESVSTNDGAITDEWDWRNRHGATNPGSPYYINSTNGWVTPIKDQGECGSCWAFSPVSAVELIANLYFNTNLSLDLSEQEVLSCAGGGNCGGGNPSAALLYIKNIGATPESCFPYTATDDSCTNRCSNPENIIKISSNMFAPAIEYYNERVVKRIIIEYGSIVQGMYGSWTHAVNTIGFGKVREGDTVYDYTNTTGIVVDPSSPYVNTNYWIFKNSYGPGWGENGYGKIILTKANRVNGGYDIVFAPIISSNINYEISCRDEDHDGYYNWGLSTNKPTNCPPGAYAEKDADDSDPGVGPFYTNYYPRLIPVTNFYAGDGTFTDKVALSWTRNESPQVLGFAIWRDGGPASVCLTTNVVITGVWGVVSLETNLVSTNFDDTTALPGTNYTYRLGLYNLQGMGGDLWSSNTGYRALSPVAGVSASDGTYYDKVRLTWSAAEGAAGYRIYRHSNDVPGSASSLGTASTTNYDDTTASIGLLYYYWVKATNAFHESDFSASDSGWRAALSAPTEVIATDGAYTDRVRVTWGAVTDAAGYTVWRNLSNDTGSAGNIGVAAGTTYYDTTGEADTNYYYWVKATNASGVSGFSSPDIGRRVSSLSVPNAPAGVTASDGAYTDKVQVSWGFVTNAAGYSVWRNLSNDTGSASNIGVAAGTNYADTDTQAGMTYYYWLKATNAAGSSGFSDCDSGWRAQVPTLGGTTATNIMAHAAYLGGNITATNGYPVTERGIYWSTNSGVLPAAGTKYFQSGTFGAGAYSMLVSNLPAGRTNYFLAYAVNGVGTNFTGESSFLTRPDAPVIMPATNTTTTAFWANWLSAESATNYWLDVGSTSDFSIYAAGYSNRLAGAALTFSVTGLQARAPYFYRVRAENATGVSTDSAVMTVKGIAQVSVGNLSQVYDGSARTVSVATIPAGLNVTVTYDGSAGAPVGAGNYEAAAIVAEALYHGGATSTLVVAKADQTISFSTIADQEETNRVTLAATASSGLPVNFAVVSGLVVIEPGNILTFTGSGAVSIVASQGGNGNWNAAANKTNTFNVVAVVTHLNPPQNVTASDGTYTDKVAVTWSAVSGASGYQIWRAGANNVASAVNLGNATISSYADTSSAAQRGTMWFYWVKACNSVTTSEFSAVDSGFCRSTENPELISGQPMVGDYDGDRKADPAVYDLANGRLSVWLSSAAYALVTPVVTFQMAAGDLPVADDFDGDWLADPGIFQRLAGSWFIWLSSAGYYRVGPLPFGVDMNDTPIPADYDGDGKADPAVCNAGLGWYVWLSSAGYYRVGPLTIFRVDAADIPAPGKYDADLLADPAIYQAVSGNWFVWLSSAGYFRVGPISLGTTGEHLAVPADYDGDGLCDPAAYIPSNGVWRIWESGNGYTLKELPLR